MFSNQHVILHFTSGDERHTTSSILRDCNWELGAEARPRSAAAFSPKPSRSHSQSTGVQGPHPPASTGHRCGTLLSPAPSLYPPDPPRAISSRERLGASTHLCPLLSGYRHHTIISPTASAPEPDGPVTWPQLLPKVQSQDRW